MKCVSDIENNYKFSHKYCDWYDNKKGDMRNSIQLDSLATQKFSVKKMIYDVTLVRSEKQVCYLKGDELREGPKLTKRDFVSKIDLIKY